MARTPEPHRREDILEAARREFRAHGFAATHMSDVARRADIAVGTLYLYFESKDAIAKALAAEWFTTAARAVLPLLEGPLTRSRIEQIVHGVFDSIFRDPTFGRTGIPLSDVSILAPDAYTAVLTGISAAFAKQIRARRIRKYDPNVLADMFVILIRRAVLHAAASDREREPYATTLIEFLSNAMLPARRPAKRVQRTVSERPSAPLRQTE